MVKYRIKEERHDLVSKEFIPQERHFFMYGLIFVSH